MTYFFDNCISHRFAAMLAALGVQATALRDEFPESADDVTVFHQLRQRDLVFVSCDRSQTTTAAEATWLKRSGITAIYFGRFWPKMTFWQQAAWLVARWPTIDGYANGVAPGTFAEIQQNGRAVPFSL